MPLMRTDLAEICEAATRMAHRAVELAEGFRANLSIDRKHDTSLVTNADVAVQQSLQEEIASVFPGHAVIAEEKLSNGPAHPPAGDARFCWVIDPIDGTRNYAAGFPCYATSIGILEAGVPVVGVVVEHNTRLVYSAVQGCGATVNGQRMDATAAPAGGDRLLGIASDKDSSTIAVGHAWSSTPRMVCRNTGATAVHLALVACGALDGAFAKRCHVWDIAAGAVLLTEAGGRIVEPFGGRLFPFDFSQDPARETPYFAAGGAVFDEIFTSVREAIEGDG